MHTMAYKEKYPSELLSEAVEAIGTLPGVGRRSALRLALHLLRQPQENVHHFTDAINRLLTDTATRSRMGTQAKKDFEDNLDYPAFYKKMTDLYRRLLKAAPVVDIDPGED